MRSTSIYDGLLAADLNGFVTPALLGVHASMNYVATAVVTVRIVVGVWVRSIPIRIIISIVVIIIVWEEAESAAAETTTTESTAMETASHPGMEAASATVEAASKAATVETSTAEAASMKTAATKATTVAAAKAAASVAATTTSAATRQRHCRRTQANGRDC